MYVYGQLTAPNPDKIAIKVTPITPTRPIHCSIENIPAKINLIKLCIIYED